MAQTTAPTPPAPAGTRKPRTTHVRVYRDTAQLAARVAEQWGTSQVELYRYLVELAAAGRIRKPRA